MDNFDWKQYVLNYRELQLSNINNEEKALNHWINNAVNEDRTYLPILNHHYIDENICDNLDENNILLYNLNIRSDYTIINNKQYNDNLSYFINSISYFNDKNLLIDIYNKLKLQKYTQYKLDLNKKIISFIMSHRNRPDLLLLTLDKLNNSQYNNFEVIIVDDRSDDNLKPLFINNIDFKFPIKLISINNDNNGIKCTSDVYNIAFENSIGDIIVIQNPECIHLGDIPNYIINNFYYDDYICFPCYSSNNIEVNNYILKEYNNITIQNIENLTINFNKDNIYEEYPLWYQHNIISNRCLYFCTVISRNYYKILKGFNFSYKDGFCFEDDDFIYRVKNILKLNVKSLNLCENIGVIHMFHGRNQFVNINFYEGNDINKLAIKEKYFLNENIFKNLKNQYNIIACPKIFHYYWDNFEKFSFMNLYSLRTSVYYHPDYIHIIWTPIDYNDNITWNEICNKDFIKDNYHNKYINEIINMKNVQIIKINVCNFLNVDLSMSEIHKSDILRYKLLNVFGGIWSDLDIVYIKKITHVINFNFYNIFFKCFLKNNPNKNYYYPIGLLLSQRKTKFIKSILENICIYYDKTKYQCLGEEMFSKIFQNNCNDVCLLDEKIYMNYIWTEIDELFIDYTNNTKDLTNTIGFHWFNGSDITKRYLKNIINENIPKNFNGILFTEKKKILKNNKKFIILKINELSNINKYFLNKQEIIENIIKYYNCNIEFIEVKLTSIDSFVLCDLETYLQIKDGIYIFDELTYALLIINSVIFPNLQEIIINFLYNINYIIIFSELFKNTSLQTIGNNYSNIEVSKIFFKNALKIALCNTKNINYLLQNNIYENIIYYPIGYSYINQLKTNINLNLEKNIDILCYGNFISLNDKLFEYRNNLINKINNICIKNNLKLVVSNNIYGHELNKYLEKSKIVIHIPSHSNLYTFPWAKCIDLMSKKIFYMIEENEEMYCRNLQYISAYYSRNIDDIEEKILYYLNNEFERQKYIENNYKYITNNYNVDILIKNIIDEYIN